MPAGLLLLLSSPGRAMALCASAAGGGVSDLSRRSVCRSVDRGRSVGRCCAVARLHRSGSMTGRRRVESGAGGVEQGRIQQLRAPRRGKFQSSELPARERVATRCSAPAAPALHLHATRHSHSHLHSLSLTQQRGQTAQNEKTRDRCPSDTSSKATQTIQSLDYTACASLVVGCRIGSACKSVSLFARLRSRHGRREESSDE